MARTGMVAFQNLSFDIPMVFRDQAGGQISLDAEPQRIVSIVPSQTELLADLGLGSRVVGITRYCVRPRAWCHEKETVGGTKKLQIEKIKRLAPDLVIGNREENEKDQVVRIRSFCPVWVSDVRDIPGALEMISGVGAMTGSSPVADDICSAIRRGLEGLGGAGKRVLYLVWRKPYMSVGGDTFIHDMLQRCGFDNVLAHESRYPVVDDGMWSRLDPDVVLLPSEPFPFGPSHAAEMQSRLPAARVALVDGESFSWYGSRLVHAIPYLQTLVRELSG